MTRSQTPALQRALSAHEAAPTARTGAPPRGLLVPLRRGRSGGGRHPARRSGRRPGRSPRRWRAPPTQRTGVVPTTRGLRVRHAHRVPEVAAAVRRHADAVRLWLDLGRPAPSEGWDDEVAVQAGWLAARFAAPAGARRPASRRLRHRLAPVPRVGRRPAWPRAPTPRRPPTSAATWPTCSRVTPAWASLRSAGGGPRERPEPAGPETAERRAPRPRARRCQRRTGRVLHRTRPDKRRPSRRAEVAWRSCLPGFCHVSPQARPPPALRGAAALLLRRPVRHVRRRPRHGRERGRPHLRVPRPRRPVGRRPQAHLPARHPAAAAGAVPARVPRRPTSSSAGR